MVFFFVGVNWLAGLFIATSVLWHFTWIVLILHWRQCQVACGCVQIMLSTPRYMYHPLVRLVSTAILSNALFFLRSCEFQWNTFKKLIYTCIGKCHGQCLASWTPSQEVHVLCTQGCHVLCFCTPVALIFTLLANLLLYTCIVSTTEIKCICNIAGPSSILGHKRCYKLLA